ncbi:MAG: hypothetical protein CVU86_09055 [Firmicutes bacterium HGW-Firmicutes-11]|nr:MAG: hypothetical protein CVU86_09055 [Firmicutes bacterium HGW-Firmicutes-11]
MNKEFLYNRNPMKVLSYLSLHAREENIAFRVATELGLSQGSVHGILKEFAQQGLAKKRNVGKSIVYEINGEHPVVRAFRKMENLLEIDELINQLKSLSRKVILYGSCAFGVDTAESDIDLFIVADRQEQEQIEKVIRDFSSKRKISPLMLDLMEMMQLESDDPVFFNQVMSGIELWEKTNGST